MNIKPKFKLQKNSYKLLTTTLLFVLLISSFSSSILMAQGATIQDEVSTLSELTFSEGTLSPPFDPMVTVYTVGVANSVDSITISAVASDENADISGDTGNKNLAVGDNDFVVTVTTTNDDPEPETYHITKYTITVNRAAPSGDALLSDIKVNGVSVPDFDSAGTSYAVTVAHDVADVEISVTGAAGATFGIVADPEVLVVGENTFTITVTAEDGTTTKVYTVVVTVEADVSGCECETCDACGGCLEEECCDCGECTPCSCSDVSSVDYLVHYYLADTDHALATAKESSGLLGATVNEDALDIPGYTADSAVKSWVLEEVGNVITFYYVPNNCAVSYDGNGGAGEMADTDAVYNEDVTLSENVFERTGYDFIGWATSVSGSVIYADGEEFTYDFSRDLTLFAKWSAIEYSITYVLDDGVNDEANPATYTIEDTPITLADPTKEGYIFVGWDEGDSIAEGEIGDKMFTALWGEAYELSDDATLSVLSVSVGVLSPSFVSGTQVYTVDVDNGVDSLTISVTASNAGAVVSGDTGVQSLAVGVNVFTVTVTAQDGVTTKTYTVIVTRADVAPDNTIKIGGMDIPLTIENGIPTLYWAELTPEQQNAIINAHGKEVTLVKDARGNILYVTLLRPVVLGNSTIAKIVVNNQAATNNDPRMVF